MKPFIRTAGIFSPGKKQKFGLVAGPFSTLKKTIFSGGNKTAFQIPSHSRFSEQEQIHLKMVPEIFFVIFESGESDPRCLPETSKAPGQRPLIY